LTCTQEITEICISEKPREEPEEQCFSSLCSRLQKVIYWNFSFTYNYSTVNWLFWYGVAPD